jgi:hypothetical protein
MVDNDCGRPLTSFEAEQRRLGAIRKYDEEKLEKREKEARIFLESHRGFLNILADRGIDDEQLRQLALDAAAKECAANPLISERLGLLADHAAKKAHGRHELQQKQTIERGLRQQRHQARPPTDHSETLGPQQRPDYFARNESLIDRTRPKAQWLGKYRELDDLARAASGAKAPDHVQRQQRQESDRRQAPPMDPIAREERRREGNLHPAAAGELKARNSEYRFTPGKDLPPNAHGHTRDPGRGGRGGRSR